MVVQRTSTSLVQFLGASITAKQRGGKLSNIISDGLGGERTIQADVTRIFNTNLTPASVNIAEFHAALGHLQSNNVAPLIAKTMALILTDVAAAQNINVMSLIDNTNINEMALVSNTAYTFINQLRDGSSQLTGSKSIDNSKSLRARYLLA